MTAEPSAPVDREQAGRRFVSPIESYLRQLHATLRRETAGAVATYIPELSKAGPDKFGICVATVDGQLYAVGDAHVAFTIQSMSKPFTYGAALDRLGSKAVLAHVGVEPTGDAFNAILLDDKHNRPFNPMVNAGAIAVAELIDGETPAEREAALLALFARFAGRPLAIDEAVYRSESLTGHRNRAIAYMMLNSGMIRSAPEAVLDLYFRQCSILVTCADMAAMAATLANRGVNPMTGEAALRPGPVRDVLTVMTTCGMYNYAGQWAYDVGLPAKSGVSGGIIAVIPGQAGIAVWSPPLDAHGNSVRGIAVCKAISNAFGLHAFGDRTADRAVIRRDCRASALGSKRLRTPAQRETLRAEGGRVALIEAQGALYFGSTEVLIRRIGELAPETRAIIVDFKRVSSADAAATALLVQTARDFAGLKCRLTFTSLAADGPLAPLREALAVEAPVTGLRFKADADAALETAESKLLRGRADEAGAAKYSFSKIDLLAGMAPDDYRALEGIVSVFHFEKGRQIFREGDEANAFFIIVRGSASISVRTEAGRRRRIAAVGPGFSIGEMALVEGGRRSADVFADEAVVCYGFSIDRLRALSAERPAIMTTILGNLVTTLAHRLRVANEEIRSLE